ncbi:haloacid dehalogenase [Chitiniphilus shinanonensis]|uniref:Haloacid dehalogenase n=1 Tax=Chitiniphilus shinanonensis TaxID=553088 RepID=F8WSX9_9NEIS|nr:HAD hydrolase-like protein [Chitiniphilus shinanonensis]BAK53966.1 phosphoglycolate phosphatase [Chitiniphilus shinanonensis]GLS03188.1 haloacid dehalogenase [Chitiniphilus shinanonensis]
MTVPYKLIVFDFDGTLADSFDFFIEATNALAARYRFRPIAEGEVESLRGLHARAMMRHLGLPGWKLPLVARAFRRLMAERHDIVLFDGVAQALRELHAHGVQLALVTSNSYTNVCRTLGPRNMALLDYCQCETSLFGKRARLRRVLRQSGVAPHQAICIGDELRDGEAARDVGMAFGAVASGYTRLSSLAGQADAVFADPADLAGQLTGVAYS